MLKLIYKWHKWIGVSIGVILAMWLFTGIIMVTGPRPPSPPTPRLDFSAAVISPAQASGPTYRYATAHPKQRRATRVWPSA